MVFSPFLDGRAWASKWPASLDPAAGWADEEDNGEANHRCHSPQPGALQCHCVASTRMVFAFSLEPWVPWVEKNDGAVGV